MNNLVSEEYLKILREGCEGCINNCASVKYHSYCLSSHKEILDQALNNLLEKNLITQDQIQQYKCKAYSNIHLLV